MIDHGTPLSSPDDAVPTVSGWSIMQLQGDGSAQRKSLICMTHHSRQQVPRQFAHARRCVFKPRKPRLQLKCAQSSTAFVTPNVVIKSADESRQAPRTHSSFIMNLPRPPDRQLEQ
jgi:hypothetical protein